MGRRPSQTDYAPKVAVQLYVEERWTISDIAMCFRVGESRVSKDLKAKGVTFRTRKEVPLQIAQPKEPARYLILAILQQAVADWRNRNKIPWPPTSAYWDSYICRRFPSAEMELLEFFHSPTFHNYCLLVDVNPDALLRCNSIP